MASFVPPNGGGGGDDDDDDAIMRHLFQYRNHLTLYDMLLNQRNEHALRVGIALSERQYTLDARKCSEKTVNALEHNQLESDLEDCCAVCLEKMVKNETVRRLNCTHTYHKDCIDRWLLSCNGCCPVCMTTVAKRG